VQAQGVVEAGEKKGLKKLEMRQIGDWVAIVMEKRT
jgi:hypothetical protein